jgi:hypothetical protein
MRAGNRMGKSKRQIKKDRKQVMNLQCPNWRSHPDKDKWMFIHPDTNIPTCMWCLTKDL